MGIRWAVPPPASVSAPTLCRPPELPHGRPLLRVLERGRRGEAGAQRAHFVLALAVLVGDTAEGSQEDQHQVAGGSTGFWLRGWHRVCSLC